MGQQIYSPMVYRQNLQFYSFSCTSFMADRTRIRQHYAMLSGSKQAMVNLHRPVCSKIMLTWLLTWQTDLRTSRRMASKVLLNLLKPSLRLFVQ